MKLFSVFSAKSRSSSLDHRIADCYFTIRQRNNFLEGYRSQFFDSGADAKRFEVNKDVIMMLLSSSVLQMCFVDSTQFWKFFNPMRTRYLDLISAPSTSLVGDYIVCADEIAKLASRVTPACPVEEMRRRYIPTSGLLSFMIDFRIFEFWIDHTNGKKEGGAGNCGTLPIARRHLSRVRNVPAESIPFDHVNYLGVDFFNLENEIIMQTGDILDSAR